MSEDSAAGQFEACVVCGAQNWGAVYRGAIRDGSFGNLRDGAVVSRCGGCGVERLAEEFCKHESFYQSAEYREHLAQAADTEAYFRIHDELQIFTLEAIWPRSIRDQTVADIGCAGGSFLDHVAGVAKEIVAVEPSGNYHEGLAARGFHVYPYVSDVPAKYEGSVNFATSLQVIEHVENPRQFLADIRPLLAENGLLLVSTPNRRDILMDLLPDNFPSFFYRVVHRWYFDAPSLARCAKVAGYTVTETRFVHRYGMSNMLAWLRDRAPSGLAPLPNIDALADRFWKGYLERAGLSDTLYMTLRPAD